MTDMKEGSAADVLAECSDDEDSGVMVNYSVFSLERKKIICRK
jgi:hypothetical protein